MNTLPFSLSLLSHQHQMKQVLSHRQTGYGQRSIQLGNSLALPEPADQRAPGREIIIATNNMDQAVMGSVRLHVGFYEPTAVEKATTLPEMFQGKLLMDASRYCCLDQGPLCRTLLFKAAIQYAQLHQVDYFVLATIPKIAPLYKSFGFKHMYEDQRQVPIAMAQNALHYLMYLDMHHVREQIQSLRPTIVPLLLDTDHSAFIQLQDAMALENLHRHQEAFQQRILTA